MNKFDFVSMPAHGGFIAFYRMVHHSKNFVLRDGCHDIIFATAAEAKEAAGEAFKAYLLNERLLLSLLILGVAGEALRLYVNYFGGEQGWGALGLILGQPLKYYVSWRTTVALWPWSDD